MLLLTASLTMGLAFVLGLIESLVFRRNVLPLAAQAAEYLGGTMTAMALIYGAYLLFAAGVAQALSVTSGSTPQFLPLPSPPAVVAAVLVTVTLAFPPSVLLGLAYLHWRIVAGGRWNNV
jgi:hypothetical protein